MNSLNSLQTNLKNIREEKNMSQTSMAKELNITRQAYNHYETGKRNPDPNTLSKISDILDVSIDYLLGKTNIRKISRSELLTISDEYGLTDDELKKLIEYIHFLKFQR